MLPPSRNNREWITRRISELERKRTLVDSGLRHLKDDLANLENPKTESAPAAVQGRIKLKDNNRQSK